MVRTYKPVNIKVYTLDDLREAIRQVNDNASQAAIYFIIPYSTLKDHLDGITLSYKPSMHTMLSQEEEEASCESNLWDQCNLIRFLWQTIVFWHYCFPKYF